MGTLGVAFSFLSQARRFGVAWPNFFDGELRSVRASAATRPLSKQLGHGTPNLQKVVFRTPAAAVRVAALGVHTGQGVAWPLGVRLRWFDPGCIMS